MSAMEPIQTNAFRGEKTFFGRLSAPAVTMAPGVAMILVALAAWQAATYWAGSVYFPTPLEIFAKVREMWLSGPANRLWLTDSVFQDVLPSLARMAAGWSLAAIVGISLGVAIGRSRALSELIDPSLQFLRAIPAPALIPIFMILLGTDSTMRVSLIAFSALWPILLNTIEGVRTVEPGHLSTAASFRIPGHAQLFRVVIPAAGPKIMAGLRVSLAIALILMVISEMVAATSGIGYLMIYSQLSFLLTEMWAGLVLLSVLGFSLNALFTIAEARILRWHVGARQRNAQE